MTLASMRRLVAFRGGTFMLKRGRWRPAAFLLGRAIELVPGDWEAHNNLAIALLKLRRWEEAAGIAQRAIKLNPAAGDSYDFFGIALLQLERWEEAVAVYRRALVVDPKRYELYDRLGMALWRLDRWDEVVETYEQALIMDGGHYAAHHRLGMAQLQLGRWDAAATALRRALALAATDSAAASELGGMQMSLATAEEQVQAAAQGRVLLRPPHPGTVKHLERGVELLVLHRWEDAVGELAKGSALSPDLGGLHFLQVDPLVRLGRLAEAVAAHRRAVAAGGPVPSLPGRDAAERFKHRQGAFWSTENLEPNVFAVERWLETLSAVPEPLGPGSRLLFVLDNDFGELTTVKCFLLGQKLTAGATLLLPETLYSQNDAAIPGRTHRYGSVEDILVAVDREQPEIVFLCSAYLFWAHLRFTPDDIARLIDGLRERGCRTVTADPFLGLLSKQDARTLIRFELSREDARNLAEVADRPQAVEELKRLKRTLDEQAWSILEQSEQILRDTYHLYPSYCEAAADDDAEMDARNLAFFNDRLLRPAPATAGTARPHWLFVLSNTDYDIQAVHEGEAGFADIVASRLVETRAAGRHPILIGPRAFLDQLMQRMPTAEGIDILAHCPFSRFMSLLLSAEHVFYWNAVSHSLLIRLYNQLPIVLFDRGHLIRTAPAIRDRIVRWYYQGWEPPLRDHHEPLTLQTVEQWTAEYRLQAARLVECYRQAPAPQQIIAELMDRALTPGLEARVAGR
jgi:Flp pilus assembly protein TadD